MYSLAVRAALPEKAKRRFAWQRPGPTHAGDDEEEPEVLEVPDPTPVLGEWHSYRPVRDLAQQAVAEVKTMAQEALIFEEEKLAMPPGPAEYLVDNSALQAHAPGITFRFSKRMEDRDDLGELAAFGSIVLGIDEGDGWLRAQNPQGEIRFLPMELQGVAVVSKNAAAQHREAQAERLRRREEAERHQRDLEAWQRRAAEAERAASRKEEREKAEQAPEPRGFAGRTKTVLERHYAGEDEEAPDHYQVLGVPRHASQEEISQAYRALSKLYHPDRLQSTGGMLSQAAVQRSHEQRMAALNAARRVLSDTRLRHAYDKTLPEEDEEAEPVLQAPREKSEEQYDFDFMGPDRPLRSARGRAARAAKACGSRDQVRLAMDQLRGKERMTLADKDGQIRPSGPVTPFAGLGECGDPDCMSHRLAWPQVRSRFRDFIVGRFREAVKGIDGRQAWWNQDIGLRYTSIGSGQLLFDLELLERIRALGVRIAQICLVDTAYAGSPPSVEVRRALREFADWQRAAAQLCRHEPAEVLVFAEVWDYYETCCEAEAPKYPDLERYRQPCDLLVHCDAAWPGADEEVEQLAQVSLGRGGLLARLSQLAPAEVTDIAGGTDSITNSRGHSLGPLVARAWVQMDELDTGEGYCPSRPSHPLLVEVDGLEACREAIDATGREKPSCDLQLARILAEAREKAQKEARRKAGKDPSEPSRRAFEAPFKPEEPVELSFREEQPSLTYFRDRQSSRARVPGRGHEIQKGKVFENFKFLSQEDPLDMPKPKAMKQGLSAWKVVYHSSVAVRAAPKATGQLVGQLQPGDVAYCDDKQRSGNWIRVEEVPGQKAISDAWVLTDGTDFGMGILLQKVEKK
ncbi:unnamed protein product [Effrenium voratum]|uniref:J domain-containing protein n=1 Tax=Effrenium voratum TaxID=2562239 RepID=A0AA36HTP7_9DINO|nr:unnamed protein product [Effrenium voratum]CAJ1416094.1 unnamed protein product [Effrenium voratum]